MIRVAQRTGIDCGVAALAMVLDRPYEEVSDDIAPCLFGISRSMTVDYLDQRGCDFSVTLAPCERWNPEPIAPAHLLLVSDDVIPAARLRNDVTDNENPTYRYHWVAMDGAGTVFDPWPPETKQMQTRDYRSVVARIAVLRS